MILAFISPADDFFPEGYLWHHHQQVSYKNNLLFSFKLEVEKDKLDSIHEQKKT